jgi:hypothetical protein
LKQLGRRVVVDTVLAADGLDSFSVRGAVGGEWPLRTGNGFAAFELEAVEAGRGGENEHLGRIRPVVLDEVARAGGDVDEPPARTANDWLPTVTVSVPRRTKKPSSKPCL